MVSEVNIHCILNVEISRNVQCTLLLIIYYLNLPKLKLDTSRHNFLYNSSLIWNELIGKILEKSDPNPNNIMIPGSSPNSDLSASISLVKKRLKKYLLGLQEVDVPTRPNEWLPLNFCKFSLND